MVKPSNAHDFALLKLAEVGWLEKEIDMKQNMTALKVLIKFTLLIAIFLSHAQADRLKDLTSIAGVRSNQLVGYGLVVGLPGTGDGNSPLTLQSMQAMISQFGYYQFCDIA